MTSETLESQFEKLLLPPEPCEHDEEDQGPQISRETVERTRRYIDQMIQVLFRERSIALGNPYRIMRDGEGGVDVEWRKTGEYVALMNVSEEGTASYYWERYDKSDDLKGNLKL